MFSYAITTPFTLKWKYVAPANHEVLEYFVTPHLSMQLHRITNGKHSFAPVGFLSKGNVNLRRFETEEMPRRSKERIELAFEKEEVSCFFTQEEAQILDRMFEEEKFICTYITIHREGLQVDLFELDPEDFERMLRAMGELGVHQIIEIDEKREPFEKLRDDMYTIAYKKATTEFNNILSRRSYVDKKKVRLLGLLGGAAIAVGIGLKLLGKFLVGKGVVGTVAGLVSYAGSVATSLFGVKVLSNFVDQIDEGVIFQ